MSFKVNFLFSKEETNIIIVIRFYYNIIHFHEITLKKMTQGELQEIIIESETFCKYRDPAKQELINAILGRVNVRLNYKILMGT